VTIPLLRIAGQFIAFSFSSSFYALANCNAFIYLLIFQSQENCQSTATFLRSLQAGRVQEKLLSCMHEITSFFERINAVLEGSMEKRESEGSLNMM
jgi:hypothetical protein